MKRSILAFLIVSLLSTVTYSQKYLSKTGHIWFFSSTAVEDIEAHNHQSSAIINSENGEVVVSVLMKSFEFEKALMEEHFNENYIESDKFPKGKFKGSITNIEEVDFSKNGDYEAAVSGALTIHGTPKDVETKMNINVKGDKVRVTGKFSVSPSDFDIKIPKMVADKIAKNLDVNVDMEFSPYKK